MPAAPSSTAPTGDTAAVGASPVMHRDDPMAGRTGLDAPARAGRKWARSC